MYIVKSEGWFHFVLEEVTCNSTLPIVGVFISLAFIPSDAALRIISRGKTDKLGGNH